MYICLMRNNFELKADEKAWLKEIASGKKAQEVAKQFGINYSTFAFKLSNIRVRFGATNITHLIAIMYENNLHQESES